jgi:predicted phosphoribosyltransferase
VYVEHTTQTPARCVPHPKLGYPGNPEYAVGAITEMGLTWFNADASDMKRTMGFKDFLDEEISRQQCVIERQQILFRQGKKLPPLTDTPSCWLMTESPPVQHSWH